VKIAREDGCVERRSSSAISVRVSRCVRSHAASLRMLPRSRARRAAVFETRIQNSQQRRLLLIPVALSFLFFLALLRAGSAPRVTRGEYKPSLFAPEHSNFASLTRLIETKNVLLVEEKVIARHRGERAANVYFSLAPTRSDTIDVVYKLKHVEAKGVTRLVTTELNKEYTETASARARQPMDLGPGEDPRAFRFRNQTWCLTWYMEGADWTHFIVNVRTGERKSLNGCVSGFRGKNWIPLPFNDTLYVAYRVHPRLQLFSYDINASVCQLIGSRDVEPVTEYRGGSNGIIIGSDSMMMLGHRTLSPKSHQPYVMLIDMGTLRTLIIDVRVESSTHANFSIFDPTSLWVNKDGTVSVGVTLTSDGPWSKLYHRNCSECWFTMSVYSMRLIDGVSDGVSVP